MKPKFEYQSELDYKLHIYEEKLDFAKYQIKSQLKDAYKRRREETYELKLWSGVLIAMLICFVLSVFMSNSVSILVIPGVLLMFASVAAMYLLLPICVYNIVKGVFLWSINKENKLGKWLVEKCEIPTQRSEIVELQTYLNRYNILMEDLEHYREEIRDGVFDVDEAEIYHRFETVNYKPEIVVVSKYSEKLKKLVKWVSIISWIILMALIIWAVGAFAISTMKAYWNMYKQI
ncbi:MAG: hypothetical protein IJZ44_04800 [Lachnospiraceae bacterium]|nr:hypothetical protein [Lachnospiraceae bacterium]